MSGSVLSLRQRQPATAREAINDGQKRLRRSPSGQVRLTCFMAAGRAAVSAGHFDGDDDQVLRRPIVASLKRLSEA